MGIDEFYSEFESRTKVPNNYDLKLFVFEYDPNAEEKYKTIFEGYFPYARLFPFKDAHMFGKFMLSTTGQISDEDGKVFNPEHGKYYTFLLVYEYYRLKKKTRFRWKKITVFYK